MVQGMQHKSTIPTEIARLFSHLRFVWCARKASHANRRGRSAMSVALVRRVTPQRSPQVAQSRTRCDSDSAMVAQNIVATKSAERDASHMLSTGIKIALGKMAQSHAAVAATPRPAMRLPAKKSGTQVRVVQKIFSRAAARNELNV